jgi:hypothetical protein
MYAVSPDPAFSVDLGDVRRAVADRTWRPSLTAPRLGWESYAGGTDTLWFDDIAIGPSRIGC